MRADSFESDLDGRLEKWAARQSLDELSQETARRIDDLLIPSLAPVRPLPSRNKLVLRFIAVFAVGALALMGLMDKAGFHLMTHAQMVSMAAILTAAGVLLSVAMAHQMVPGSRERFPVRLALASSAIAAAGAIWLLFPWVTPRAFVSEGWPCAVMESIVALPAAGVFWLLARRGAFFSGTRVGAAVAGLAVVLSLLVQQFRCMFPQAPHLLVWHGATAAILIGLGALIGSWQHPAR